MLIPAGIIQDSQTITRRSYIDIARKQRLRDLQIRF